MRRRLPGNLATKAKKRRPNYSLRGLLILITGASLLLGHYSRKYRLQDWAHKSLVNAGAELRFYEPPIARDGQFETWVKSIFGVSINVENVQSLRVDTLPDPSVPKYFPNLEELDVGHSKLHDLRALKNLGRLKSLRLESGVLGEAGQIESLKPLRNAVDLEELIIPNQSLGDIETLRDFKKLIWLDISNNPISDLGPIANATGLMQLDVGHTNITDLDAVGRLTALRSLSVSHTRVTELAPVANLANLQSLNFQHTAIADLSPLANLTRLETVYGNKTRVQDLTPIRNLFRLQQIDFADCQVEDVSVLTSREGTQTKLTDLVEIVLSGNPLNEINPLGAMPDLKTIILARTNVSDLSGLQTPLSNLDVRHTKLTDLMTLNPKLAGPNFSLWVGGSNFKSLVGIEQFIFEVEPFEGLSRVATLYIEDAELTDLSHLSVFKSDPRFESAGMSALSVTNTPIEKLRAEDLPSALKELYLEGTRLTEVEFEEPLPNLQRLKIANSRLTKIEGLENLDNLKALSLSGTEINNLSFVHDGMQRLVWLDLSHCPINDWSALAKLKNLGYLDLTETGVDVETLEEIRSWLPGCKLKVD